MSKWRPIATAPWQTTVLVKNDIMDEPVRATRGYQTKSGTHPNKDFFTSVYTPDKYFPMPSGHLVCPTVWKPLSDEEA